MEEYYFQPDDHMYIYGKYHYYKDNVDDNIDYNCYISYEKHSDDKNSKYKFLTKHYDNSCRFIVFKKKYNINFIKNIKLLLKKYNIDDLYNKIIDKIDNDYDFNHNFDIYDYKLHRIVNTVICWSDDYEKFEIENDCVKEIIVTYHGFNRCYIRFKNGIVDLIEHQGRKFNSGYKLGDKAPSIDEI